MKLQTRSFVARKPETIDITAFFKKFCIATRTKPEKSEPSFPNRKRVCIVDKIQHSENGEDLIVFINIKTK